MKKYIQKALARFIFDEDLETIKLGIKVAQMPIAPQDTTTERPDLIESVNDIEGRVSNCEDFEYRIDELESDIQEMKNLSEHTEEAIDELKNNANIDFADEFTNALAQPEFVALIETIIKNERAKSKKKPKKKA